jgi:hypothetical protein
VRSIAIATGMSYLEVYDLVLKFSRRERGRVSRRTGVRRFSHPRTGVFKSTMDKVLDHLGWEWVSTMGIGTGCTVHLDAAELPEGRIIARVSRHYVALIDGVIHDTGNPSRGGSRCVYGYWRQPAKQSG